mmetsp:Transcript_38116/g.82394  ORF Transcript_38116/g.82394 Transcript_38116/m.82394 type:complete len:279 (+) Transcript_38116:155-991(+)
MLQDFLRHFGHRTSHVAAKTVRNREGPPVVVIFNWDDTLFCTSQLALEHAKQEAFDDGLDDLPLPQRLLRQMDGIVCRLVQEAVRIGQTFIVTNSSVEWVERSAKSFLPGMLPLLDEVTVVSARSTYERKYPMEMGRWKDMAFLDIARRCGSGQGGDLLVIGNSELESHAADVAGGALQDWRVKVFRLQQHPSVHDLMVEQRLILDHLAAVKESRKSLTVTLEHDGGVGNSRKGEAGDSLTDTENSCEVEMEVTSTESNSEELESVPSSYQRRLIMSL